MATPCLRAASRCSRISLNAMLRGGRHRLVHAVDVRAFDEVRRPAIAAEQIFQFVVRDSRQQGRIVDLVSVEVQDRKNGAVARWVKKFVDMPGSGKRTSLGFTVADDRSHDQFRIIECGTAGVRENISEFAAFVN